jgi:hypothetical protein
MSTTPYVDACGTTCLDVHLPDFLDEHAAAWLILAPRRCLVLHSDPWMSWTVGGVQVLAHRVAGRVPVVLDDLCPGLADELERAMLAVLDWAGATA